MPNLRQQVLVHGRLEGAKGAGHVTVYLTDGGSAVQQALESVHWMVLMHLRKKVLPEAMRLANWCHSTQWTTTSGLNCTYMEKAKSKGVATSNSQIPDGLSEYIKQTCH